MNDLNNNYTLNDYNPLKIQLSDQLDLNFATKNIPKIVEKDCKNDKKGKNSIKDKNDSDNLSSFTDSSNTDSDVNNFKFSPNSEQKKNKKSNSDILNTVNINMEKDKENIFNKKINKDFEENFDLNSKELNFIEIKNELDYENKIPNSQNDSENNDNNIFSEINKISKNIQSKNFIITNSKNEKNLEEINEIFSEYNEDL